MKGSVFTALRQEALSSRENDPLILEDGKGLVFFHSSEEMLELDDGRVTLTFTSPPYWDLKDYGHPEQIGRNEPYDAYLERLARVFREVYRVSKENGILAVNIGTRRVGGVYYPIAFDLRNTLKEVGWNLIDDIIWYIPNNLPQPRHYINKLFDNKYEHVLIFAKSYRYDYTFNKIRITQKYRYKDPRSEKKNPAGRCIGNVWKIRAYRPPNIKTLNYHVAAFPEELAYAIIYAFSNPGDIVLDPFLGSGTTLKVALNMGRLALGYEINHDFKELIRARANETWTPPQFSAIDPLNGEVLGVSSTREVSEPHDFADLPLFQAYEKSL